MFNSQGFGESEVSSSRSHLNNKLSFDNSYENQVPYYRRKGRSFGSDESADRTESRRREDKDDWRERRSRSERVRDREHSASQDSNENWDLSPRDHDNKGREKFRHSQERTKKVLLESNVTSHSAGSCTYFANIGDSVIREGLNSSVASSLTGIAPTNNMPGLMAGLDPSPWAMNPFGMMGLGGDPNLLNMINMSGFGQLGFVGPTSDINLMSTGVTGCMVEEPTKEIIRLPSCVLYPPRAYPQLPVTREKPPGCRTVFIGGLPENVTEEIIHEVFERCGEITAVRMSKKNFCHVRFENESVVENAIYLSGYRIKIGDSDEPCNTGRLHVDYAQARDDRHEWECKQRAIQRELRHRERLEQERLRPPSPPPVVHYSDFEAALLIENIKGEESFQKAVQILITWLERGECNKRNAGQFYSMIQSTNSHVRRLMNEKGQYEEELNRAKELLKQRMQGILLQFNQIYKVFSASSHQKVWDHFTKAQRKNIDMWRKQTEEIKNAQVEDVLNERIEAEMEVSDGEDEGSSLKKPRIEADSSENGKNDTQNVNAQLREENDSLRCQIEAYENEIAVLRSESKQEKELLEKQVKFLQQALQGMQHQLLAVTQQRVNDEAEISKLQQMVKDHDKEVNDEKQQSQCSDSSTTVETVQEASSSEPKSSNESTSEKFPQGQATNGLFITEKEACLIGLIGTFLHVHPFGAGVDYIWSYLQQFDSVLTPRDVESLLSKFPSMYKQELSGVGATLERKWIFCGFNSPALAQDKRVL